MVSVEIDMLHSYSATIREYAIFDVLQKPERTLQMQIRVSEDTWLAIKRHKVSPEDSLEETIRRQFNLEPLPVQRNVLRFQSIVDLEVGSRLSIPWLSPGSKEQATMNRAILRAMNKIPGRRYGRMNTGPAIIIERLS